MNEQRVKTTAKLVSMGKIPFKKERPREPGSEKLKNLRDSEEFSEDTLNLRARFANQGSTNTSKSQGNPSQKKESRSLNVSMEWRSPQINRVRNGVPRLEKLQGAFM